MCWRRPGQGRLGGHGRYETGEGLFRPRRRRRGFGCRSGMGSAPPQSIGSCRTSKPGKYYLGLWQETQGNPYNLPPTDPRISEYWPEKLLTCAISTVSRCGSRALLILCRSNRVSPLAELQTGGAIELKPGDELAVRCLNGNCVFLRLALYRQPPRAVTA